MALIAVESFDYWADTTLMPLAGGWTYQETVNVGFSIGRHGNYGVPTDYISKVLTPGQASSTLIFGAGILSALDKDICTFGAGSPDGLIAGCTPAVTVHVSSDARVKVYQGWGPAAHVSVDRSGGSAGSLLAQSAVLDLTSWKYLEVKVTSGAVVVNVEDVEVINVAHSGGTMDNLFVWRANMDDLYLLNGSGTPNTFVGTGARVAQVFPDGDYSVAWTPQYGSDHWDILNADNNPGNPFAADWVWADADGTVDLLDVGSSPALGSGEEILGVVVSAHAQKMDAGPRSLALMASASGTTAQSADLALDVMPGPVIDLWNMERAWALSAQPGGAAWTEAAFNAAKFGFKARDSGSTVAQVDRLVVQILIGPGQGLGGWGVGMVRMGAN
jgi:hypothetical protein